VVRAQETRELLSEIRAGKVRLRTACDQLLNGEINTREAYAISREEQERLRFVEARLGEKRSWRAHGNL
jgi:hypothetical protein